MSNLPLHISGQDVVIDQLAGFNYLQGFPEIMGLLIRQCENPVFGYALAPCFIYPLPGKQRIYALPGRSWQAGQRLRAYRIGDAADWRTILVHSYNKLTGEMRAEIMAASNFTTAALSGNGYFFTPYFSEPIGAGVVALTGGGTGGVTVDEARTNLKLPVNSDYQTLFSDFLFPDSFCRQITNGTDVGAAQWINGSSNMPFDFSRPGMYQFKSTVNGTVEIIAFGRTWHNWADMTGDNAYFECAVNFRTLSTGGLYQFEAGLIGPTAKVIISYKDTLNTARFQVLHGVSSSYTTVNSVTTVAGNTWYKIIISIVGANIVITANGTTIATFSKTAYQSVAAANLMVPMMRLTQAASGAPDVFSDYMYFRKPFPSGR